MPEIFYNIFIVFFITISCGLFGYKCLSISNILSESIESNLSLSIGLGFGILVLILNVLGFTDLLNKSVLITILIIFLILGSINNSWAIKFFRNYNIEFNLANYILLFIFILAGFYLLLASTPTLDGDSLFGYLILPREYVKEGGIRIVDYSYGSTYPQNGQLISSLGFMLGNQITAQIIVIWMMGVMCISTLFSIGKIFFNKTATLIGIFIWYGTLSVAFLSQSAKIDLAWTFFELLAILAFINWYFSSLSKSKNKWLILAGFFLGIAGGIKQATIFTIIVLLFGIFYKFLTKKEYKLTSFLKSTIAFSIPLSVAGIWVIRTYIHTGELFFTGNNLPNYIGVLGFFQTLWDMSMIGNVVSIEGPMGKSIGPSLLAVIPILFAIKKIDKKLWIIIVFSSLMLILWYNGVQRARHLLPTVGLLSLIAGFSIDQLLSQKPKTAYSLLFLIIFSISLNLLPFTYVNIISTKRIEYLYDNNLDKYLSKNLKKRRWYPNYRLTKIIRDELPNEVKIAALSTGNGFYLNKAFYGARSTVKPVSLSRWTSGIKEYKNPNDFYQELKNFGMTHVFINDFVVKNWKLEESWLNQSAFKDKYLNKIIEVNGQHLYQINKEI